MNEETVQEILELDPNKKTPEWLMIRAKRIYRNYMTGTVQGFFSQKTQWRLNTKYSMGRQPIDNYKKWLGRDTTIQYDSLNFAVTKVMPKIFDILVGMISRIEIDIQCDAVDPQACESKLIDQYKKQAEIMLRKEFMEIEQRTGAKIQDPTNQYSSVEELQMDIEGGNVKLDFEIAVQELIKVVFNHNNIQELRFELTRDFANCGMGIIRHYVQKNGLIRTRRVNPIMFVSNFVTSRNFRELAEAGELVDMTISDLRQVAGNDFTEKDYYEIALAVQNKYNNPSMSIYGSVQAAYILGTGGYIYDKFIVRVFDCEFATTDRYVHTVDKPNSYGNKETRQKKANYKPSDRSKKYTKATDYKVWYGTKWIVGTSYAYGAGKIEFPNVEASALNESKSTFAVCALYIDDMITQTITERCIEWMDDIVLSFVQMQSYTAKAVPPGIGVDTAAISNIPKGKGATWDPLELIEYYSKTGNTLTNMLLPDGRMFQKMPIVELKGSDLSNINFWMNKILADIDMIKQVFGLNDSTDASNPNPEASVTGQRLAVQGTNNSLQPLITAMDEVFIQTATGIVNRAQHMASLGQLDYLANAVGRNNLMVLGFSDEISTAVFAMKMTPRMSDQEKATLQGYINTSLAQRSQTGIGGIEMEDAMAIERCTDLKMAERMLTFRRKMRAKQDEEKSARLQQQNAAVQTQSAKDAEAAKQGTMKLELQIFQEKAKVDLMKYAKEKEIDWKYDQLGKNLDAKLTEEEMLTQGKIDFHNSLAVESIISDREEKANVLDMKKFMMKPKKEPVAA